MKTILLIGDSIRMGYQAGVKTALEGQAAICAPEENCRDSRFVLQNLSDWLDACKPDIVHLNVGLHDLKTPYDSDARQVPLPEYEQNLHAIFEYLHAQDGLSVIWASTTPVNEEWHHATKGFDRYEEDVRTYNATALALVEDYGFQVDDLYSVIIGTGRDALLRDDGVHYTPEGCALLAGAVAGCLREHIEVE